MDYEMAKKADEISKVIAKHVGNGLPAELYLGKAYDILYDNGFEVPDWIKNPERLALELAG